jgi:trehalose 6-phosphate synthase
MARTIATAASMPLTERRMRWEAMMDKLRQHTIQQWFADFIAALRTTRYGGVTPYRPAPEPPISEAPAVWPPRSASGTARYH